MSLFEKIRLKRGSLCIDKLSSPIARIRSNHLRKHSDQFDRDQDTPEDSSPPVVLHHSALVLSNIDICASPDYEYSFSEACHIFYRNRIMLITELSTCYCLLAFYDYYRIKTRPYFYIYRAYKLECLYLNCSNRRNLLSQELTMTFILYLIVGLRPDF